MTWEQAVDVLRDWTGRRVLLVTILEPGVSLRPFAGVLEAEAEPRVVRLRVPTVPSRPALPSPDGATVVLRKATFLEAGWVPGRTGRGLTVVQGGLRVDVFLDGPGPGASQQPRAASSPRAA